MINLSKGEYIVFIYGDDRISGNYVDELMNVLYNNLNADCIVFDTIYRVENLINKLCKYGIEFEYGDILD